MTEPPRCPSLVTWMAAEKSTDLFQFENPLNALALLVPLPFSRCMPTLLGRISTVSPSLRVTVQRSVSPTQACWVAPRPWRPVLSQVYSDSWQEGNEMGQHYTSHTSPLLWVFCSPARPRCLLRLNIIQNELFPTILNYLKAQVSSSMRKPPWRGEKEKYIYKYICI